MRDREFLASLAQRFGTPLYAYDLDEVGRRLEDLRSILPATARLYYSLKANPLPALGNALGPACGAEVSSPGELAAALEAGFDRASILYTGPGKTESELRQALAAEVGHFSCESWAEVRRLARLAAASGVRPRVLLRVSPSEAPPAGLSMARESGRFGLAEATLLGGPEDRPDLDEAVELVGVHVYLGTQVRDAAALEATFRIGFAAAERVAGRLGLPLRVIDAGGGFPWPYATAGAAPSLAALEQPLAELCRALSEDEGCEVWFESGRYLCAAAGTLVARVLDVKLGSDGRRFVVLDAGINALGGLAGLGRLLTGSVSVIPLLAAPQGDEGLADVVGPLCTPLDVLARNVLVPHLAPGSLIAIPNVGAYGLTASLVAFLSRPFPVEVVYRAAGTIAAYRLSLSRDRIA
jgi:diaminopimelate decarboxylase